jgi:hypothetical protein
MTFAGGSSLEKMVMRAPTVHGLSAIVIWCCVILSSLRLGLMIVDVGVLGGDA